MSERHNSLYSGHVGCDKTFKAISRYYWWKTTRQYVLHHVGSCLTCQLNKSRNEKPSGLPQPVEVLENSLGVSMDIVTGMPKSVSGLDAILVMVDVLRWPTLLRARPPVMQNRQLSCLCTLLCACMGCPSSSLRTKDPNSQASSRKRCCASWGQGKRSRLPAILRHDGRTERMNANMEDMLRHYVSADQNDWHQYLDMAEFVVNSAEHESKNKSPSELNYGSIPRTPTSLVIDES